MEGGLEIALAGPWSHSAHGDVWLAPESKETAPSLSGYFAVVEMLLENEISFLGRTSFPVVFFSEMIGGVVGRNMFLLGCVRDASGEGWLAPESELLSRDATQWLSCSWRWLAGSWV